ncbi:MAG: glucosamine-6-phosphate deaminase [Treponema sp.]|nr:glucosamine-6-phosphate deaminase [Treponema sp.]
MRVIIKKDYDACAKWTADYIAGKLFRACPTEENPFVLGLPTGSTPLGVYKRLVELNAKGLISFKNVITFNMDEYSNLDENHPQSYHYFMNEHFFSKIDIKKENVHILDGTAANPEQECLCYEECIRQAGGIDLFLGGCGGDGHIAFNEPGSSLSSRTRMKTLTEDTILANARFFGGDCSLVPRTALTVGIGTITDAKEVLIMMTGPSKADALQHAVEESVSQMWPVTILQMHRSSIIVADDSCTDKLRVGTVKYFNGIEAKITDSYESIFANK